MVLPSFVPGASCRGFALAFALLVPALANAAAPTLCTAFEQVAFSCPIGKKVMSVCVSGDLAGPSSHVEYRFGRVGAPVELSYPARDVRPTVAFEVTTSHLMAKGAHYAVWAIEFVNQDAQYTVHWLEGDGDLVREEAEVRVRTEQSPARSLKCSQPPLIGLEALRPIAKTFP